MTVHFEDNYPYEFTFDLRAIAEKVISQSLEYEGCPYEAEVNIMLVSNQEIHRINLETRGIDKATDVLSFPMVTFEAPSDYRLAEAAQADCFEPDSGELMLGDIVISKDKVAEQAAEYGHSEEREYAFLIAHSMLHLMGYDHIDEGDAEIMEKKQKEILEQLKIRR